MDNYLAQIRGYMTTDGKKVCTTRCKIQGIYGIIVPRKIQNN